MGKMRDCYVLSFDKSIILNASQNSESITDTE